MRVPGTTASAPDVEVGVLLGDGAHALAEVDWVAGLEMPERAQRDLVHHRGVRTQAADPFEPVARLDRRKELERVRTVDPVERRTVRSAFGVDCLDGLLQARPGVQAVVAVQREQD